MSKLFAPNFGGSLSSKLLDAINIKGISGGFHLFNGTDPLTNRPMNPLTFEVFDPEKYLAEIQFALDISPSVSFAAPGFKSSDILDSLYPSSVSSVKAMLAFAKKQLVPKLIDQLSGLFDVEIDMSTGGLTLDDPNLGNSGLSLGNYSGASTQLFPPRINLDNVQGFFFDITVDIQDGPTVSTYEQYSV